MIRNFQVQGHALRQKGGSLGRGRRFEARQDVDHGELDRLDVDDDARVLDDAGMVTFDNGHVNDASASDLPETSIDLKKNVFCAIIQRP